MSKNNKKTRKNKDKVPPASEKLCSVPINQSMDNEKSERFQEETSDASKNKANLVTSSQTSQTNTDDLDTLKVNPKPPSPNPEEVSKLKNNCNALKSNLNTMKKKYENEKEEKEKLLDENQVLKSELSTVQKELEAAKLEIEMLIKERDHPRKSTDSQEQTPMEVEPTEVGVCEQPVQKEPDDFTWEEKEHNLVLNNAQGTELDAGLGQGSDQGKNGNLNNLGQEQWGDSTDLGAQAEPSAWSDDVEIETSSQTMSYCGALQTSGSGTRKEYRRGSDTGQKRNEWPRRQGQHRNEVQNRGHHNRYNDRANRHEGNNYRPPQERRRKEMGDRDREHQNWNPDVDEANIPRPHQERWRREMGDRDCQNWNPDVNGANIPRPHPERWRREMGGRGNHHQNWHQNADNRNRHEPRMRSSDKPPAVTEIFGDLFDAPQDCSLAHCVAEDMRMGSGIAVTFRQKFKRVDELLDQRKRQGQVAVLEHEGRYIYYLVTKPESTGKPTMVTLERSLLAMRDHVTANDVKKIAMPRIGCGLDRLEWRLVRPLIEDIFSKTDAQITIYNYNEDVVEPSKSKPTSNIWLMTAEHPVADIAEETAILCLCTADGSLDSTFRLLDQKFRIITDYEKMDRQLGNILPISRRNYWIILLIVKEKETSYLSFKALGNSMRQACKHVDKEKYYYVALEAFDDKDDPILFQKVVTVVKSCLDTKRKKELWLCWPKTVSRRDNTRPNSET